MQRLATFIAIFCSLFLVTETASAAQNISRRDGFVMIWQSLKRPAEEVRKDVYTDVPPGSPGALEINYGRYRGFLSDDVDTFHPNDPLDLSAAAIWLLKTRNVDDLDAINDDTIPGLALKYDLITRDEAKQDSLPKRLLTSDDLVELIQKFDHALDTEVHEASLYAEKFQGKGTAFGESFDMYALTAAHRTFPYNTLVKVTNVSNQKSVIIRVNDRGPFVKGRDMDLSLAAFTSIEDRSKGKLNATFERLGDANIVGVCTRQNILQQRLYRKTMLTKGIPQTLALGGTLTVTADMPFVVLSERYPDGQESFIQNWILPGEEFTFKPSIAGEYRFQLATRDGQKKTMQMTVAACD